MTMAILKTLKNVFFGVNNDIRRVDSLRSNLESLGDIPTDSVASIEYLVKFFNTVSVFQDDDDIQLDDKKLALQFNRAINRAGRNLYGINRTEKGEIVTLNNIWLGDVCGLFTHPASWWIKHNDQSALDDIAHTQVIPFIYSNRNHLLELCYIILK